MASSKDYLIFVLNLLRNLSGITYKKMMGEYLLYKDSILFGGIYDNRFLIKKSEALIKYHLTEAIPYPTSKMMYVIDSEDPDEVEEIVRAYLSSF